jgi:hydrogenase maturation protease
MSWLVIGIGNTLRRDDGLGPWLAEQIAAWRFPAVTSCTVHQLMPELVDAIAKHERVLFLDACESSCGSQLVEVEASSGANRLGHALSPGDFLSLTDRLGFRRPHAWLAAVPGSDFGFGDGLSADAKRRGAEALVEIGKLLREAAPCTKSAS